MCSLFGSLDRNKFIELAKLNEYRGTHSHSISVFDFNELYVLERNLGSFKMTDIVGNYYYIGHSQSPTTNSKSTASIHPSSINNTFLWHNGIIKDYQVREWQKILNKQESWDTRLLHYMILNNTLEETLSNTDGSFACTWWDKKSLYLFRNENSPLFTDGYSYSSTKFKGSESIKSNTIYELTINGIKELSRVFTTKNEFYWSIE